MKKIITTLFLIFSMISFAEKASNFELKDQYDINHTLTEYKGKVILLNFWINYCQPCKEKLPIIESLYKEYSENKKDIIILGINKEKPNKVKKFLKQNNYSFPTLIDKDSQVVEKYSVKFVPTSFIINKNGDIVGQITENLTIDQIKEKLDKAKKFN